MKLVRAAMARVNILAILVSTVQLLACYSVLLYCLLNKINWWWWWIWLGLLSHLL